MTQPSATSDRSFTAGHAGIQDPVYIALIKLEAKLDTIIQTNKLRDDTLNSELKHIREDYSRHYVDHEARLRALEGRKYVEPKTVWMSVGVMTGIGSLVVAIINLSTR